jgi:hypothetical protein
VITRVQLSAILWIAAALWGALLLLDGVAVSLAWIRPFSTVLGALVLLLGVFDQWAWRFRFLHPWFVSTPDLQGTWKGQLISTWVDPEMGDRTPPIEGYLVVRQTFSSLHMRLITRESNSELLSGSIVREMDGTQKIVGTYRNTPRLLRRDVSPIHHGGLLLQIHGRPPSSLDGQYWTDRDTKGELRFTERSNQVFYDFESAAAGMYEGRLA